MKNIYTQLRSFFRIQSIEQVALSVLLGAFLEEKFIPMDEEDSNYAQLLKSLLIVTVSIAGAKINTSFWNFCFQLSAGPVFKLKDWVIQYPESSSLSAQQEVVEPFKFLQLLKTYTSSNPDIFIGSIIDVEESGYSDVWRYHYKFSTYSAKDLFKENNAAEYKAFLLPFYMKDRSFFIFAYRQNNQIIIERHYCKDFKELDSAIKNYLHPIFYDLLPDKKITWKNNESSFRGKFESSEYWMLYNMESILQTRSFNEEKGKVLAQDDVDAWLKRNAFCKLIQAGIAHGKYYCGSQPFTPIQQAVRDNRVEVVRLLIKHEADPTDAMVGLLCLKILTHNSTKLENIKYFIDPENNEFVGRIVEIIGLLFSKKIPEFIPVRYVYTNIAYDREGPVFIDQRRSTPLSALTYCCNGSVDHFSFKLISVIIKVFLRCKMLRCKIIDINAVNPDGSTALSNFLEFGILPRELASNEDNLSTRRRLFRDLLEAGADLTQKVSKKIPRIINNKMRLIDVEDVIDYTLSECDEKNPNINSKIPELKEYLKKYEKELMHYLFAMIRWGTKRVKEKTMQSDLCVPYESTMYVSQAIPCIRAMRKFLMYQNEAKPNSPFNGDNKVQPKSLTVS